MANKVFPLKRTSSYKEVSATGKKLRLASWITLQIATSPDSQSYFGVTVSRKVGSAVIRNKLKRWVRNCVRTEKWPEKLQSKTIVFVFKPQADALFYSRIKYSEFKQLFEKI